MAGQMIALSSTAKMLRDLAAARNVFFSAYILRPGPVEDALVKAAQERGAHVHVRLPAAHFHGNSRMALDDRRAIARLRAAGADAALTHALPGEPGTHLKAAVCDGVAFLDDRNWLRAGDTVLKDDNPRHARAVRAAILRGQHGACGPLVLDKDAALRDEARLVGAAGRGDHVDVEAESVHRSHLSKALLAAAQRGVKCRLLIEARECDPATVAEVQSLARAGVQVRAVESDEKFAVVDRKRAWCGSANATASSGRWDGIDWGMRTDAPAVVQQLEAHFNAYWKAATPLPAAG
jgi:phosphatidylserine/phosphatidylglycerophosphate/cardiolipin synthase-like enzyme